MYTNYNVALTFNFIVFFPIIVLSKRRRRKRGFFPVGPRALLEACENLCGDKSMYCLLLELSGH